MRALSPAGLTAPQVYTPPRGEPAPLPLPTSFPWNGHRYVRDAQSNWWECAHCGDRRMGLALRAAMDSPCRRDAACSICTACPGAP